MRIVNYGSFQCFDFKCQCAPKSYLSLLRNPNSFKAKILHKWICNFVLLAEFLEELARKRSKSLFLYMKIKINLLIYTLCFLMAGNIIWVHHFSYSPGIVMWGQVLITVCHDKIVNECCIWINCKSYSSCNIHPLLLDACQSSSHTHFHLEKSQI